MDLINREQDSLEQENRPKPPGHPVKGPGMWLHSGRVERINGVGYVYYRQDGISQTMENTAPPQLPQPIENK